MAKNTSNKTTRKKAKLAKGTMGLRSGRIGSEEDRRKVQETFLAEYAIRGVLTPCAKIANITLKTHYDWLKLDKWYKEAFHEAQEAAADILEIEARRRAVDGVEEPVGFYKGKSSETITRYSDPLLKTLLEGRRAKVFKQRHELTGPEGGPIQITHIERVIVDPKADGDAA